MGIQILMQKSTKIKMAILSVITLMTVGTTAYQINKWSQSYNKMEQQKFKILIHYGIKFGIKIQKLLQLN